MTTPALEARELSVSFDAVVALDAVTVAVPTGTTVAVIGPNGSGKSTLLRAAAGLVPTHRGRLTVPARSTSAGVALVLQSTQVDTALPITVRETVRMGRYARLGALGRFGATDHGAVDDAIDRLELTELAGRQLHELSGGQRQRALVAQGLAQGSELLLLDEPMTGLDLGSRSRILEVTAAERAAGRTVILSTHDLDDARRCDLVLLLATRVIAFGPPAEVLVPDRLRAAYGGRVVHLDDTTILLDDPHHDHDHAHGTGHDHGPGH